MNDQADAAVSMVEPITVQSSRHHGAVVIRVEGEVDMDTCDDVRAEVVARLDERPEAVVLDLTAVTIFGSIGLTLLIEARHRAEQCGVGFAVATYQRAVLRPLAETGVGELLLLRATVREAAQAALAAGVTRSNGG